MKMLIGSKGRNNPDADLQRKPFAKWTKKDIEMYTTIQRERFQEDVDDGLMEDFEYEDFINCWKFEVVGNALIKTRIAPPSEEISMGSGIVGDLVVGHCSVVAIEYLAYLEELPVAEKGLYPARCAEIQNRLHEERNVPDQELKTVPRPAHLGGNHE
ncbi:TPA: hypothetical protein KUM87_001392 [Escherichia coli]|uniref:hypothetical protein n=2 Tax=Escherichia coli TaxID=562 RepID=UPI000BE88FD0|nr:hypothetical protein [Escherichia coli]EFC0383748.1 hypothetical protein [Escherichia coli]EFH9986361.1 hypothetical protein [Escherichia coli]EFI0001678.1 hypothetical protein [Escherichia coli]EFJ3896249.1 hypothetical protein [Escherichia coli]EFJ6703443.1 hypothetical protein [Escherichia coli]